jgi:hypothetical protein
MAYLSPQFEWDVFVSYAHGTERGGRMPLRNWSRAFIETLIGDIENLADDLPGLRIWYDRDIDPTAKLTEELRKIVKASGVLLILISNRYLESDWCKDEREWFESQLRERTGGLSRIFVVHVQATDHTRWPRILVDERGHPDVGFQFHPRPEREGDDVAPWGWDDLVHRPEAFCAEFARLRTVLCRRMRELKRQQPATPSPAAAAAASAAASAANTGRPPRVYLHGVDENAPLPNQVMGALQRRHIETLSLATPRSSTLADLSAQSRRHIDFAAKRCDAMALIREPSNPDFDFELIDIADDQERIATVRGRPMPWAVLDAAGQALPAIARSRGAERFDLNQSDWVDRLQDWLRGWQTPAGATSP